MSMPRNDRTKEGLLEVLEQDRKALVDSSDQTDASVKDASTLADRVAKNIALIRAYEARTK